MDKRILLVSLILAQLAYANCGFSVSGIISAANTVGKIIDSFKRTVEVHNEGTHDAHLWCAKKNRRVGGEEGIWVKPGDKLEWSFRIGPTTQYWCTMDYNDQRVGWDVFVYNWFDAPNPTKWSIRDDGVYDQWKERKWRDLSS